MLRIIFSWVGILWILCSFASLICTLLSLLTPTWLIRQDSIESRILTSCPGFYGSLDYQSLPGIDPLTNHHVAPSIGILVRCQSTCSPSSSSKSWWSFDYVDSSHPSSRVVVRCQLALVGSGTDPVLANPPTWLATCVCLIGFLLQLTSTIFVITSLCKREICNRSLLSLTGSLQCVADFFLFLGLLLWPIGWDSVTVREVCGGSVGIYLKGQCSLGWAPLIFAIGLVILLVSAVLSILVDRTVSKEAVTRRMLLTGKSCVFIT